MSSSFEISAGGKLAGSIPIPGDKSISHRAVMLGSIARGETTIEAILGSDDVRATVTAFRKMGVKIEEQGARMTIQGVGLKGLRAPDLALDMGNSGTAMRLMTGLLAGLQVPATLTGDESLSRRPMNRVVDPLRQMGADINVSAEGYPPVELAARPLTGMSYITPVASAQVKSAVLLAGMGAAGETRVRESSPTRDHTERMLRTFLAPVAVDGEWTVMGECQGLRAANIEIPADLSSAAFFMIGAAIAPGSDILLPGVGINPTRGGVIRILKAMGADVEIGALRHFGDEPVSDIRVRSSTLHGIDIPPELVPLAIDEFPILAVAAACASGSTTISNAEELRVKESDRIATTARALAVLGVDVEEKPDGMIIHGNGLQGGIVDSAGDHRIAMAFSIAALRAKDDIVINDVANVATSFPDFDQIANAAGLLIRTKD